MKPWSPGHPTPSATPTTLIVDNRKFVLGLDERYREAMKQFESTALLACARAVAQTLQVPPANVPIEGYYTESPALTEYFRLIRALQEAPASAEATVKAQPEFQQLWAVYTSPLYGRPQRKGKLLPVGRDPLSQALLDTAPDWHVPALVEAAYTAALKYDDFSLVGLAARTRDAVVLAATRESVVLAAELVALGMPPKKPTFIYEWQVDLTLTAAANRFIKTFNNFVPGALPQAAAPNAEVYYKAYTDNPFIGRCVRLGQTQDASQSYHWAITVQGWPGANPALSVDSFWSEEVWTTDKYRAALWQKIVAKPQ